ncbi:MAG: MFS transporter [Syntrophomonadaceae bacterium]|nr:MFS transporter [Syntrophomonadaceae bacterium]
MIISQAKDLDDKAVLTLGKPSIWTRNFILLCLANLVLYMSTNMLIPSLPRYLLKIGGNPLDVGYVMAAYTIGAMFIRPFGGWLVDNYGRKRILILGMIMMLTVSFLYTPVKNVSLMMLVRSLHGVSLGLVSTAIGTIVADSLPTGNFSEGMGYFGLTNSIAMAVAPIVGFGIVENYGYPLLFVAVIMLTTLAFGSSMLVRANTSPISISSNSAKGIYARLLEKSALLPACMHFSLALVFGSMISFVSLHAAERGVANIGLFFTAWALTMLLSRPISGRWADCGSSNKVLFIGHLAVFIGMMTLALSQVLTHFLLAGIFIGLGFGFILPTLQALAVRNAPINRRGAATATFYVASDLGIGLGTILAGYVATASSYQIMYFTTLIPIVLSGVIYFKYRASANCSNIAEDSCC